MIMFSSDPLGTSILISFLFGAVFFLTLVIRRELFYRNKRKPPIIIKPTRELLREYFKSTGCWWSDSEYEISSIHLIKNKFNEYEKKVHIELEVNQMLGEITLNLWNFSRWVMKQNKKKSK